MTTKLESFSLPNQMKISTVYEDNLEVKTSGILYFGPNEWKKYIGEIDDTKIPTLPKNIKDLLSSNCPVNEGESIGKSHSLIYLPELLSNQKITMPFFFRENPIRSIYIWLY
jgi:hypothetical protein